MGQNDWKYFDYEGEDSDWAEEREEPSREKQCARCLHWVAREALYCPWCGKPLEEKGKR